MKNLIPLVALAAVLSGCGAAEGGGAGDLSDRSQYPAGPYGKSENAVIENLSFVATDGSPFTLNDVFADEKNRVLLLTATAGWCNACIVEQPDLVALHREFGSKGLVVVAAMFEDANSLPATVDQVREWKNHYQLPYEMVLDRENKLGAYYRGEPPLNLVIDVDDMQIKKVVVGTDKSTIRAVIMDNLDL